MSAKKTTKTKGEAAKKTGDEPAKAPPAEPKAATAKAAEKKPKKVSALDAAARVVAEARVVPM